MRRKLVTVSYFAFKNSRKGRARDNSRTERFFRSLKYEEIYLNEYENPRELRKAITDYLRFYHSERPHQALGYKKPEEVYPRAA